MYRLPVPVGLSSSNFVDSGTSYRGTRYRMRQLTDSKISNYKQRNSPEQKKSAKTSAQNSGKNSATSDQILFRKLNCKLCSSIPALPRAQSNLARSYLKNCF